MSDEFGCTIFLESDTMSHHLNTLNFDFFSSSLIISNIMTLSFILNCFSIDKVNLHYSTAYTNYITSPGGIIVDFTTPEPGPIGKASLDLLKHDGCDAAFNHKDRCVDVTPHNNHR